MNFLTTQCCFKAGKRGKSLRPYRGKEENTKSSKRPLPQKDALPAQQESVQPGQGQEEEGIEAFIGKLAGVKML